MTKGQGSYRGSALFFPAPFDSSKALNSGGLGAGPQFHRLRPKYTSYYSEFGGMGSFSTARGNLSTITAPPPIAV